jgi:hypothetical protein
MSNQYDKPGATAANITQTNNTDAYLTTYLGACQLGIANDTGLLIYKDKDLVVRRSTANRIAICRTVSSGPVTVLYADEQIVATSGTFTVLLPAATGSGRTLDFSDQGAGIITITASGSDKINGDATKVLTQFCNITIRDYSTAHWCIV